MTTEPLDPSRLSPHALSFGSKPAEAMSADPEWGDGLPEALVVPDERWQNLMVGTKTDLQQVVDEFPIHPGMPDEIGRMLLTSRQLFVHSYFMHEFAFVGAVWSVFAVEAALKQVLSISEDDRSSLKVLTGKAQGRGLLTSGEGERLRYGAMLRNGLVHSRAQGAFPGGTAALVIEASHELTNSLYERSGPSES